MKHTHDTSNKRIDLTHAVKVTVDKKACHKTQKIYTQSYINIYHEESAGK
jgi:hypothetical protein